MQVRGKTRWCFSVILAFSKSLHESCRLFAFYRRAADFFLFTGGLPRFDSKPAICSMYVSKMRWFAHGFHQAPVTQLVLSQLTVCTHHAQTVSCETL